MRNKASLIEHRRRDAAPEGRCRYLWRITFDACHMFCQIRQKGQRVNLSRRLLRMLEVQRDRAWHDIVTLDESWFYLSTVYEFVWLPRDEEFPKENDTQFNRKNSCSQLFGIRAGSI
jgi:hypothetical protein